ncbi:hypothetical protein C477_13750 [Haloterrigena salina JCM 13891]|uniref:DUF4242 domain-containing protein n=1 Tax=Haloterrigena salina JCM 13891 TaxID=1227488 RepID=M0C5T1_9EURY|nr:DUF4242 domain-containing protein [Haloterrigena salina]ELZ17299.1 hypothetical protein C477_13750 [Haloterrigena salina JCM 13891]
MSEHDREQELEDFLILRELDKPITEAELEAAGEQSGEALSTLRDEGVGIRWVESEVLTTEDGDVTGTFCHYRAESEDAIREHADRAGLPATRIDRRGEPLEGE